MLVTYLNDPEEGRAQERPRSPCATTIIELLMGISSNWIIWELSVGFVTANPDKDVVARCGLLVNETKLKLPALCTRFLLPF